MTQAHILGLPRIGSKRELKFALESYWQGKITENDLLGVAKNVRQANYQWQKDAGMDYITAGDFCLYDHLLDMSVFFNIIPTRHQQAISNPNSLLDKMFLIARGKNAKGDEATAGELTKWFDTNYHYIVPEFEQGLELKLNASLLLEQIKQAKSFGRVKVVLQGVLSYLWLGKGKNGFDDKLSLFEKFKNPYQQLITQAINAGAEVVQIDEPCLVEKLPAAWITKAKAFYEDLDFAGKRSLLNVSYEIPNLPLQEYFSFNFDGFHLDTSITDISFDNIVAALPENKFLSLGVINGRNIWKADLSQILQKIRPFANALEERFWICSSCSLLHSPLDLNLENDLDPEVKNWLSFGKQKLEELNALKHSLNNQLDDTLSTYLQQNQDALEKRRTSKLTNNVAVKKRLSSLKDNDFVRTSTFIKRKKLQQEKLNLPLFPTTTIGSFPQTPAIRTTRKEYKSNKITTKQYVEAMKQQVAHTIKKQEQIGLDVLVHGEAERNDMVEYFGEQLEGFLTTSNGWVQSYGSRCVKPPVIFGDVTRPKEMTIEWICYAQSLTSKIVKGMLTGPVTILQWSFVRDDQLREITCNQIALSILDEVQDLEKNNINVIQVDEPALREGLPLRQEYQNNYLRWATQAFKLSTSNIADETQIHTHMCYCEFNDIMEHIIGLDADVISIETSRSQMELLEVFKTHQYPNEIGPGVYDIHSPRVATVDEIADLLIKATNNIKAEKIWVNPDCGLKTRKWEETEITLKNMVQAAQKVRRLQIQND